MRRRNRRRRVAQPRAAQRAPGLGNWRPVSFFVSTEQARNIRWGADQRTLIFDVPSQEAEGSWDRWIFELQHAGDTAHSHVISIENNVRGN